MTTIERGKKLAEWRKEHREEWLQSLQGTSRKKRSHTGFAINVQEFKKGRYIKNSSVTFPVVLNGTEVSSEELSKRVYDLLARYGLKKEERQKVKVLHLD